MLTNTTGSYNNASGYQALYYNTASYNVANGYQALFSNTTGYENVANGYQALYSNSEGYQNTAYGHQALYSNTTAVNNTAIGWYSLRYNTTGQFNTATGHFSLGSNTTGNYNTADGDQALYSNTTGFYNAALGYLALYNNGTGSNNTAVGYNAGPSATFNNTTALGNSATTTASNQVRVGNSSVTSIGGQVGWSTLSDGRFKKDINEDVSGLGFINQLRAVSYFVDRDAFDKFLGIPDSIRQKEAAFRKPSLRQTGFVAQEVEKIVKNAGFVFNGIDAPQNEKDYYSIRYSDFVVPLVKAVQELSTQLEYQKKEMDLLKEKLGVEAQTNLSGAVALFQNIPNPFSSDTEIKMTLPDDARQAIIIIYNLEGKQLKSISVRERGNAVVKIPGYELDAGMYIYTLIVDSKVIDTKRMILIK